MILSSGINMEHFTLISEKAEGMKASECKCCKCGKRAVAFWPVCDPDIPAYPYCRKCLDKEKMELFLKIQEIDRRYERDKNRNL